MDGYLGVDVGSEITECAISAEAGESITCKYFRTQGKPVAVVRRGLGEIEGQFPTDVMLCSLCIAGSARYPAYSTAGADVVEDEITAQAMAALYYVPDMLYRHRDRWYGFGTHHDA
jgi:activator of 2-hydroxyglutaryl-CoA dehydratase